MNGIEFFPALRITATALDAERTRMEVAASNMANAHSTRGPDGGIYQRQQVVFSTILADTVNGDNLPQGVQVSGIVPDSRPPIKVHAPFHPDADKDGMISTPDISPMNEMMDMITATRAYEANLSVLRQCRDMARETINLGRQNSG